MTDTSAKDRALIYTLFDEWLHSQKDDDIFTLAYKERQRYAELASVAIDSKQAIMFASFIGGMQAALALMDRLGSSDTAEDQTSATAES